MMKIIISVYVVFGGIPAQAALVALPATIPSLPQASPAMARPVPHAPAPHASALLAPGGVVPQAVFSSLQIAGAAIQAAQPFNEAALPLEALYPNSQRQGDINPPSSGENRLAHPEPIRMNEEVLAPSDVPGMNRKAKVIGIFSDGRVSLAYYEGGRYPGYIGIYLHAPETLARLRGSFNGFSVGERVISMEHPNGKIVGIFPDGRVAVAFWSGGRYAGYSGAYTRFTETLAHGQGASNGFSVGDLVITLEQRFGKIIGIFNDGRVALALLESSYSANSYQGIYIYSTSRLAHR